MARPTLRRAAERALVPTLLAFYAGLAALYLALDAAAGLSLHPWLGWAYAGLGAPPALLALAGGRARRPTTAALALFLVLVAAAPALDTGPRKPFLRAAAGLAPGMALEDAERRMAGFERRPAEGLGGGAVVFRNVFGPGDVDSVVVRTWGGRVAAVELLPD